MAMRKAGMAGTNPGDPRLLALIEQGATIEEFAGAAAEAVAREKGFAYALKVIEGRRADAAKISLPPVDARPWTELWPEVVRRGSILGLPWSDLTDDGRARNRQAYLRDVVERWERHSAQAKQQAGAA